MRVEVNGIDYDVEVFKNKLIINNKEMMLEKIQEDEIVIEGKKFHLDFYEEGEYSLLIINGMTYVVYKKYSNNQVIKEITAPISGKVTDILIQIGSMIEKGDGLFILEAMKMYNEIKSPIKGKIKSILVNKNQSVKTGEIILVFE